MVEPLHVRTVSFGTRIESGNTCVEICYTLVKRTASGLESFNFIIGRPTVPLFIRASNALIQFMIL